MHVQERANAGGGRDREGTTANEAGGWLDFRAENTIAASLERLISLPLPPPFFLPRTRTPRVKYILLNG